jgi:hypothetical protein
MNPPFFAMPNIRINEGSTDSIPDLMGKWSGELSSECWKPDFQKLGGSHYESSSHILLGVILSQSHNDQYRIVVVCPPL